MTTFSSQTLARNGSFAATTVAIRSDRDAISPVTSPFKSGTSSPETSRTGPLVSHHHDQ
jgi:hypothetical protein